MTKKTKIIIAGIGGVGGYFGGLLAKQFSESNEIEIYFLARGENLKQIQKNGLKVIKGDTRFIVKPKLATDNANEIGIHYFCYTFIFKGFVLHNMTPVTGSITNVYT